MPSVIALLECREALAREELESWLEAVREAEEHVAAARQRVDHARIAREEVLRALAEEGAVAARRAESGPGTASVQDKVDDLPSVPVAGPAAVAAVPVIVGQAVPTGTGGGVDRGPLFHAHPATSTCVRGITHTEIAEHQSLHHHALKPACRAGSASNGISATPDTRARAAPGRCCVPATTSRHPDAAIGRHGRSSSWS